MFKPKNEGIMMLQYKAVLLDIDDTIYDYESAHKESLNKALSVCQEKWASQSIINELEQIYLQARKQINLELKETASSHNRLLYFQRLTELLKIPLEFSMELYNLYWNHFLENMSIFPDFESFTSLLQKKNIKICLLTDLTAHIQFRKIEKLRLFDKIDFLVTSEEAGKEKPHPYMFLLALKKLNLGSDEVCMIGDNFAKDILGSSNLGIKSYWLNHRRVSRKNKNKIITEVQSYKDLLEQFK